MDFLKDFGRGSWFQLPLFVCLAAALSLCSAAAKAIQAEAEASLRLDPQGRVLVDVVAADGQAYPFLLDTAASRTVVYRTFVSLLDLEASRGQSRRVITATGPREMQVYRVGKIHALGTAFDLKETVAFPDPRGRGVYGILGIDIMHGRRLALGGDGARFLLEDDEDWLDDPSWLVAEGRPVGYGSLAVTVTIAGVEIPAIVDTGAGATVLNRMAGAELKGKAGVEVGAGAASVSATAGSVAAEVLVVEHLTIGDWRKENQRLVVADLPVFSAFGAKHAPAMILGADVLLSAANMVIDFKAWRLCVQVP